MMNAGLILTNIQKHIQLNVNEQEYFINLLEEVKIDRNQKLLNQGDPCHHIYFVCEGLLRTFFINEKGKESTVMFATPDWWVTDMYCFLNSTEAMVNIQAVEKSTAFKLSKRQLDQLYIDIPAFNEFFRILMQNAYCREQLRMIKNLSLSALERYEQFVNSYPEIVSKVPQKQIASYLGITPEFLSSIRASRS